MTFAHGAAYKQKEENQLDDISVITARCGSSEDKESLVAETSADGRSPWAGCLSCLSSKYFKTNPMCFSGDTGNSVALDVSDVLFPAGSSSALSEAAGSFWDTVIPKLNADDSGKTWLSMLRARFGRIA